MMQSAKLKTARQMQIKFRTELHRARQNSRDPSILTLLQLAADGELQRRQVRALPLSISSLPDALAAQPSQPRQRLRRSQKEDDAIRNCMPMIELVHLQDALDKITWPDCDSRRKVLPDGVPFVKAFIMGLVATRFTSHPVVSKTLMEWPHLAQLLTSFINQHADPHFEFDL